ncbi:MAG: hypothetical protein ACFFAJ_06580 [Candidatus Hodarchaeota archaeon]
MTVLKLISLNEILAKWNNLSRTPLNIEIIDETIGGLLHGYLHVV